MIREWADTHHVVPVRREGGTGESGRFEMVPERQATDAGQDVDWDMFFSSLDDGDHVVVYHGDRDERPLEVTQQNDVLDMTEEADIEEQLLEGDTVTSTITETTVVESVVTEEIGVESELVDTDIIDQSIVDVNLVSRETTGCRLVKDRSVDARAWFSEDRYLAHLDTTSDDGTTTMTGPSEREWTEMGNEEATDYPYHVESEVEETWAVTRELSELFTVESRITGSDVSEADRVEDHDIDTEGLHRSIIESGIISDDRPVEDILATCDIESSLSETNQVTTEFTRDRVVEDEVLELSRLFADITGGERAEMRRLNTVELVDETEPVGEETIAEPTDEETVAEPMNEVTMNEPMDEEATQTGETVEGQGPIHISEGEKNKTVVDVNGKDIGIVDAVDVSGNRIYVDTNHGIGERIMSALGWGDKDDDYPIPASEINQITDDTVELELETESDENR